MLRYLYVGDDESRGEMPLEGEKRKSNARVGGKFGEVQVGYPRDGRRRMLSRRLEKRAVGWLVGRSGRWWRRG